MIYLLLCTSYTFGNDKMISRNAFFGNKSFIAKTAPYFQGPVRAALGLAVMQHLFYFQFFEIKPMFSPVSFVVFFQKKAKSPTSRNL